MEREQRAGVQAQHPYRMGRRFSLGRNKYYRIVYRRGKSFPGRSMVLVYLKDRNLRVGFSISAKVGGAVTRNRIRRWMYEDFRVLRSELKPGRYVFSARTAAARLAHPAMALEMRQLLMRAKLFQEGEKP